MHVMKQSMYGPNLIHADLCLTYLLCGELFLVLKEPNHAPTQQTIHVVFNLPVVWRTFPVLKETKCNAPNFELNFFLFSIAR
jgi:hypothetical protein